MAVVEGGAAFVFKLRACFRRGAKPVVDMVAISGAHVRVWVSVSLRHLPPSACRSWRCIYLFLWLFATEVWESLWGYLLV